MSHAKIVKFNLNPSYSSNHQDHRPHLRYDPHSSATGRTGTEEEKRRNTRSARGIAAVIPSRRLPPTRSHNRSHDQEFETDRPKSINEIASQETGLDLDPDILNRNKRNLPNVPSFKMATSPTMPMAKMKLLKDMMSSSELGFKRKIQVSPIPRYSMEHEMKYGPSNVGTKSGIRCVPPESSSSHFNSTSFSPSSQPAPPPTALVPPSQRHCAHHRDTSPKQRHHHHHQHHHQSTAIGHHQHYHDRYRINNQTVIQRSLPASPVRAATPFSPTSAAIGNMRSDSSIPSYRKSVSHHSSGYPCDPSGSLMHHQPRHQHQSVGSMMATRIGDPDCPACCPGLQAQHALYSRSSICCTSPSASRTREGGGFGNSDPALTPGGNKQFPSVSEITRPPFLDPSYNLVEKYEYNFDNYFRANRDRLQPFHRSSAPGSRSGTPTTSVSLVNPFLRSALTPPPGGTTSALSNLTLGSSMFNNFSGTSSRNRPTSQATAGNCDHSIPDTLGPDGQEMSTKARFKNQLKYFVEERKCELGYGNTYQPQTGSAADVNSLMNLYSDIPDPVKSKFPPAGVPAYQSVPQSYFDPNTTTFTSLRDPVPNIPGTGIPRRRHSFGGERDCYKNCGASNMTSYRCTSDSPYPSFYASYAPPTASSLLNLNHSYSYGNPSYGFPNTGTSSGFGGVHSSTTTSGIRPSSPYPRECCTMDECIDQRIHSLVRQDQPHQHHYPHPSSSDFDSYHHHPSGSVMHPKPYHHPHQMPYPFSFSSHSYPHTMHASSPSDPMHHHGFHQQHHPHQLQHQHSLPSSVAFHPSSQHPHNLSASLHQQQEEQHHHQHSHHFPAPRSIYPASGHRSFRSDHW